MDLINPVGYDHGVARIISFLKAFIGKFGRGICLVPVRIVARDGIAPALDADVRGPNVSLGVRCADGCPGINSDHAATISRENS